MTGGIAEHEAAVAVGESTAIGQPGISSAMAPNSRRLSPEELRAVAAYLNGLE